MKVVGKLKALVRVIEFGKPPKELPEELLDEELLDEELLDKTMMVCVSRVAS